VALEGNLHGARIGTITQTQKTCLQKGGRQQNGCTLRKGKPSRSAGENETEQRAGEKRGNEGINFTSGQKKKREGLWDGRNTVVKD